MGETIPKLMTIGELAVRFGVSTHRLKYAIEQYHIEPTRRVGIIRVWSEDKIALIAGALAKIAEHRGGKVYGIDRVVVPECEPQPVVDAPAVTPGS